MRTSSPNWLTVIKGSKKSVKVSQHYWQQWLGAVRRTVLIPKWWAAILPRIPSPLQHMPKSHTKKSTTPHLQHLQGPAADRVIVWHGPARKKERRKCRCCRRKRRSSCYSKKAPSIRPFSVSAHFKQWLVILLRGVRVINQSKLAPSPCNQRMAWKGWVWLFYSHRDMCEYSRRILNTADRRGVTVIEPQSSSHSRIRQSSILDCSEMENRKHQYHNWKRNRSTNPPPPPRKNWNIVECLLRSLSSCVGLLWCLREYLLPLRVQLCHIYGGLALWECQRAFILLLLKHELCHHCSDLFPSERIVPADLDKHRKSVFPIQNHFSEN